jgi:hemolysin activation/secretion protein
MADPFNGINQANVVFSQGINGLGSTGNDNLIPSRANGRVDFSKIEATFTRMQPLPAGFSVLVSGYGQYGFNPLLSSEACGFGGRIFGRAFDPSEFLGDSCLEGFAELRYDLPPDLLKLTPAQLYGFADRGFLHNIAPVTGSPVDVDAASVGGGLRLGWQNNFTADLSAAKAVQGPQDAWRFFFILAGRY